MTVVLGVCFSVKSPEKLQSAICMYVTLFCDKVLYCKCAVAMEFWLPVLDVGPNICARDCLL